MPNVLNLSANVVFNTSEFNVKVNKQGGRLVSTTPITVKNQIQEIRSIDDVPKVNNALKVDGATLVYNSATGEFDIKLINVNVQNAGTISITTLLANNSAGLDGQVLHSNGNTVYWANTQSGIIDCGFY
jgi:hypothetical protein